MHSRAGRPAGRWSRVATGLAALLLAATVSACGTSGEEPLVEIGATSGSGLNGTDVSDVIRRPALSLTDTEGRTFALQDRPADELTAVFFGYTRCPDICPTAMADLAAARRQLSDADRRHLQVVFVTEDPATDTGPVIRRWLDAFDPAFTGLVGGDPTTQAALDALKASRTTITETAPPGVTGPLTGSTVQHASSVYVFHDEQVVVYTERTSPRDYAADFHAMLSA
ncbi:MAG TPA: SCO family protein [Mycobacteriales bacterium]|jgi:protein SCO1/2|nr:SCO family protein [Mycobacteriales bacterium]